MVTSYGSFPGVRVEVAGGGITAVAIGEEEKLVLFGAANYANDDPDFGEDVEDGDKDGLAEDLEGSIEEPEQINARREADNKFGDGSRLADGMREALANGANIDFLYGVAPERVNVVDEEQTAQEGTVDNYPIWEGDYDTLDDIESIRVYDDDEDTELDVVYRYDGAPPVPDDENTVYINPLTGEYAADETPGTQYDFSYKYLDWEGAFGASDVEQIVNEEETGIYEALSDSNEVSNLLDGEVSVLREAFQLVNALSGAEPNDNEEVLDSEDELVRYDARYDTAEYEDANQSVDSDHYFKFAPVREEDSQKTILGGIGGLFAGNPITDPIYNDPISGYDGIEQRFTKSDADNMRDVNIIPLRQNGTLRVKDNASTSTEDDWERDFWRRRIADRVILIGKTIGDQMIGQINDEDTRSAAERLISAEMRELVNDRLLQPNSEDEENWFVDVYESSTDPDEVKVDIGFTPYGIVKRVDETITINTN